MLSRRTLIQAAGSAAIALAAAPPGTLAEYALDFVTIHEFGHGYFYGILASNEFEEPMLDEGLNQYWDLRMLRERVVEPGATALQAPRHLHLRSSLGVLTKRGLGTSRDKGHISYELLL